MKILIVDDNRQITSILAEYMKKANFVPVIAHDGEMALKLFSQANFDLILLDVMMPKIDGFTVCREIRKQSNVPIIMITARGEDFEKIMGLEIGADDYLVKPFSPEEVLARIKAIFRRVEMMHLTKKLTVANLTIDLDNYSTKIDNLFIDLTKKEFEILWILVSHQNKVFTRDNLLDSLWGDDYYGDSRTVDSHIKRLRAKLEVIPHPSWEIRTIWGVGYKFEVIEDVKK